MASVLAATVVLSPAAPGLALPEDAAAGNPAGGTALPRAAASRPGGAASSAAQVVVDVSGAVAHPGIYRLPPGARVADALTAAGGYGPRVDVLAAGRLNLAEPLRDGEQVLVPSRDDGSTATPPSAASGGGSPAASGPVDLNHATEAALDALPGIGPVTVRKIVDSRTAAAFTAVEDLRTRKLVSEATFAKLTGLVTVSP
jgi:competence protein ComEA